MEGIKIIQSSENSLLIQFENKIDETINRKIRILCDYFETHNIKGITEYVPYYTAISIIYNPFEFKLHEGFNSIKNEIEKIINSLDFSKEYKENIVEIPVCYGEELGPDIKYVAKHNNISVEEVIKIHTSGKYLVYMLGFAPGFPYLGGMNKKIATPRKETPRLKIPEGSVGIAGMQTGVYPIETPGGWQIIGRTPLQLFNIESSKKSLLKCGDIVKFKSISVNEYIKLKEMINSC